MERSGFAGGYSTNVVGASLDGFVDLRSGLPVVGGIVFDLVRQAAITDADVAAFAGAPFEVNRDAPQPMSLHFRVGHLHPTLQLRQACAQVLEKAHVQGRLALYGGPWMSQVEADEIYFNATRINGNSLNPDDLSRAEIQGREDARLMFELFKEHIPEFAAALAAGCSQGARELDVAALQSNLLEQGVIILERAAKVRRVGDELGQVVLESASR